MKHFAIEPHSEREMVFAIQFTSMNEGVAGMHERLPTGTHRDGGVTGRMSRGVEQRDAAIAEQVGGAREAEIRVIDQASRDEMRSVRQRLTIVVNSPAQRLTPVERRRVLGVGDMDSSPREVDQAPDMVDIHMRQHDVGDLLGRKAQRWWGSLRRSLLAR